MRQLHGAAVHREEMAEIGIVTIGGNPAAVETRGEVRDLPVFGPGGYAWAPRREDRVLVIKGGPGGQEQCVTAAESVEKELEPGDIAIRTGEDSLTLKENGRIELTGDLFINGEPYVAPIVE